MSTPLHDALAELADEITVDDVPAGLAESAWGAVDLERRRARRGKVVGALATAAAAALAFWLVVSAGTGPVDSSPTDSPTDRVGLPQRVTYQEDPPPLRPRGGPVSALVEVGTRGMPPDDSRSRDLINGGTRWQALTPDARLWSLDGDIAPLAKPLSEGQELWMSSDPALSPDGRVLALARSVQQVIHEDSQSKSTEGIRELLDIHDVTTGRHESIVDPCGTECAVSDMRWSPDGRRLAALAYGVDGPALVTLAVGPDRVERHVVPLASSRTVALAGWAQGKVLLLRVSIADASLDVDGRLRPFLIDPDHGTVENLPSQPLHAGIATGTYDPSGLAVLGDQLAVRALGTDSVSWQLYSLHSSAPESGVGWTPPPGAPTATGGLIRLSDAPGSDGLVVTQAASGEPAYVGRSTTGGNDELLTVFDPALDVQDIVLAADAPDGPVTVHRFGTRTSWWSWHPDQAALLVLVPVTLAGGWLLLRRRRG